MLVAHGGREMFRASSISASSNASNPSVLRYVIAAGILIALVAAGFVIANYFVPQAELILGLIIILGVSLLTVLLFIVAAAFKTLQLSDGQQALGLPQGSVRALIALLLIIIWAIISIYVFRFVAFGNSSGGAASADGIKLAQQLFTTMSTLVVAVSAFYFGSSSAAQRAPTSGTVVPSLLKVVPEKGLQGQVDLALVIVGKNFLRTPKAVRFVLGNESIFATGINITNTEVSLIDCTITIREDQQQGAWDLVVLNDDGNEYRLPKAFTVEARNPPAA